MSACATHSRAGVAGAKLSDRFFLDLVALAHRHKTEPEVFLAAWCFESGLDPTIVNAIGARGLNQMMPKTLKGLGAPADYEKLSGEEQLPWIERLITGGEAVNPGPFKTAARYFHSNLFPKTMERGTGPDIVVYSADAPTEEERVAYQANKCLDVNGDGRVTAGDLEMVMSRTRQDPYFAPAFERLARAKNAPSSPSSPRTPPPSPMPLAPTRVAIRDHGAGGLFLGGLLVGAVGLVAVRVMR